MERRTTIRARDSMDLNRLNDIAAWFRKKETDHERLRKAAVSGNKPFLAGCHRADATRYQQWAEAVEASIAKLGQ